MTRALTRTNFHSSKLIRTLTELAVLDNAGPASAFAEKLGSWIDFTDAIALTGVLNANTSGAVQAQPDALTGLSHTFAKARANMENSIRKSAAQSAGRVRSELELPKLEGSLEDTNAYVPLRRYHQAHQREMETQVRNLRATVRERVATASPRLSQLVALDTALDGILCEREAKLLSRLPSLFERRFNHLRKAQLQALHDGVLNDNKPEQWTYSGAWLGRFCAELQAVLLAELDLRLQPAMGLLEALGQETTKQQQIV